MKESVYDCSGPDGRANVLPLADGRWAVYHWQRMRLYVEGVFSDVEDAKKWARAVTGCKHGNDT